MQKFQKGDRVALAHTPADEVRLKFEGYKAIDENGEPILDSSAKVDQDVPVETKPTEPSPASVAAAQRSRFNRRGEDS